VIDGGPDDGSIAVIRRFVDRVNFQFVAPDGIDGCSPKTDVDVRHASARHITSLCQEYLW
jgi:hypothetical protein